MKSFGAGPNVLILDDLRSFEEAMNNAGLLIDGALPPGNYVMLRCLRDAVEFVTGVYGGGADLWVLDNDLGGSEQAFDFLKWVLVKHPGVVPDRLVSCSSNGPRHKDAEALHANWIASGRQVILPLGVTEPADLVFEHPASAFVQRLIVGPPNGFGEPFHGRK